MLPRSVFPSLGFWAGGFRRRGTGLRGVGPLLLVMVCFGGAMFGLTGSRWYKLCQRRQARQLLRADNGDRQAGAVTTQTLTVVVTR